MHIVKAVSFKLASTLMFAIMGAQARYLAGAYPEGQVAFFRALFALLQILVVFGWRRQLRGALRTKRPSDHLVRGLFSIVGTFCTFAALARIPMADFTAIAFASPLITVIFAALFLKEQVHSSRWSAVAFGFAGVLLMLVPYFGDHAALTSTMALGLLFALTNAFTAGGASIQIRRLTSTETTSSIVIFMTLLVMLGVAADGAVRVAHAGLVHDLAVLAGIGISAGSARSSSPTATASRRPRFWRRSTTRDAVGVPARLLVLRRGADAYVVMAPWSWPAPASS